MRAATEPRLAPQLVVPLDNCGESEARELVAELSAAGVSWFKVGLELFTLCGPRIVEELKHGGHKVFLDLKFHDIPNTVAKAARSAAATGADLLTVHCAGGPEMLAAAAGAAAGTSLSVVGVTVLTSLAGGSFESVCAAFGADSQAARQRKSAVLSLAKLAEQAGLSGIVCSAPDLSYGELRRLRWASNPAIFVTPGIRGAADAHDDQKSIATVEDAVRYGSTHVVVGRPITAPGSGTRSDAARSFLRQIEAAHGVATHS